jgi:hypothetical protein
MFTIKMIDKSGRTVDADAPRPSDPELKEILINLSKQNKSKR